MNYTERGLVFECAGDSLVGVVAVPERPHSTGVVIIVGGPQYRIGSHRQFVLLARRLASMGYACMRFDNRSMGDATGEARDFEDIGDDLAAVMNEFVAAVPEVDEVVLFGLCGGASAACVYAGDDERVKGVFLLNPWVRTDVSQAKAYLKHYYLDRLRDLSFWKKLVSGNLGIRSAVGGLMSTARRALVRVPAVEAQAGDGTNQSPLMEQMVRSVERSTCRGIVVLSGRDYVARECDEVLIPHPRFQQLVSAGRMSVKRVDDADHTFTSPDMHDLLEQLIADFVRTVQSDTELRGRS